MPLHVNIEDLLNARSVESEWLEFKEGWNATWIKRTKKNLLAHSKRSPLPALENNLIKLQL